MAQRDDKTKIQSEIMMRELQLCAERFRTNDSNGAAVGAVLMQNGCQYYGFNSIGKNGMNECHTHAEIMAISNSCSDPMIDTDGSLMITTRFPCEYCAVHIISHGIKEIYAPPIRKGSKWEESQRNAKRILGYADISVKEIIAEGVRG